MPINTIFITGSSGVGKTPLVSILKAILPDNFEVYDLDEKLSEVDRTKPDWLVAWRNEATKHFIGRSIHNARENKSTIICGLVWPNEVLGAPNISLAPEVKFVFLDVSIEELKKRLFARRWSEESKIADLKKDTGMTPEEYMKKNASEVSSLREECIEHDAKIINTDKIDSGEVATEIKDWLLERYGQ